MDNAQCFKLAMTKNISKTGNKPNSLPFFKLLLSYLCVKSKPSGNCIVAQNSFILQDSLVFNQTDTRTGSEKMLTVLSSQYEHYIKKKRKNPSGNNYISTLIKHILGHDNISKDSDVSHRLAIFGPGIESYRTKQIVSETVM